MSSDDAIFVNSLTYYHSLGVEPALKDVDLRLRKGSRTLLIGANGGLSNALCSQAAASNLTATAGKSTLLQILAGKRMTKDSSVCILGKDVFRNNPQVCMINQGDYRLFAFDQHYSSLNRA